MDFVQVQKKVTNRDMIIYPEFKVAKSKDLMVRGKSFYAIWDEEAGMWSTDEYDVKRLVDQDIQKYAEPYKESNFTIKWMVDFSSNSWNTYKKYINQLSDNFTQLDQKVTFLNTPVTKKDYVSRRLPYELNNGPCNSYDELMSTLYDPEERQKLEWAVGSIIAGDAKKIQKFIVLYGAQGAGKSTVLNIIQKIFEGYYVSFDARSLGNLNNQFATEVFRTNPLVAIQHDGDLSKIEDNSKLNSIISHEDIVINEKHKQTYSAPINCFLFMASNQPVKITDAKSGIIRRLIDVIPSGRKLPITRYDALISQIDFELGAIANRCLEVYRSMGKSYYNSYIPSDMIYKTDFFYNFVEDQFEVFKSANSTTLAYAWEEYKRYCDDSGYFKMPKYKFREELKNYFENFEEIHYEDGKQTRSYFSGFITEKFNYKFKAPKMKEHSSKITFEDEESIFDKECADCLAQLATEKETPSMKWMDCTTTLKDIDTSKLHYVKVPENHIVIDFDLKDESGVKSFEKNLKAASKWPTTYAELSKSGSGIHLHYIYDGDVSKLSRVYDEDIEVKVFNGNSSLRRKLTKCFNASIAVISSGLPLKEVKKVIDFDTVKDEKMLRSLIKKNLRKEIHPGTKPSVDFIYKILEDAYKSDLNYDLRDMRPAVLAFANGSSHQAEYCIKMVAKMHFNSKNYDEAFIGPDELPRNVLNYKSDKLVFFDVEVFPNLFVIVWKIEGGSAVTMINPSAQDVEALFKFKLVGFNNRGYDNHILYAASLGYTNAQLYDLSQRIISNSKNAKFGNAYNISYTDIYDFASAANKMSLKKWEIKLGIHHLELGLPWDKPVPEELWNKVAEYCVNDVVSTEEVFKALVGDWTARQILADLAEMTVNDTTNNLTTKIIFGNNRNPQSEFNYRDLSQPVTYLPDDVIDFLNEACPDMMKERHGKAKSLLPYFEGYKYEFGKSTYKGIEVGEGGRVFARPSICGDVALLDITSMHPSSAIAEAVFGVRYTKAFRDIVEGRVSIKHKAWEEVNNMLEGKLTPYIQKVIDGEITTKDLANALKTAINAVYGLTSAKFDNPFKDPRNKDNIVAKRGALFMIDLQETVEAKGFNVAHIKTDSIKIPDATPEIIDFVIEFGKRYGYNFEHEATYDKMCLVNDAVYIARYATAEKCQKLYGYVPGDNADHPGEWTATGAQFQHPYVFKTLFSKEKVEFEDLCETKQVQTAIYLDMNEELPENEHNYIFVGRVGLFTPIKEGCGGGLCLAQREEKFAAVTGTKDYRWLESEVVRNLSKEEDIDMSYFRKLVDDAVEKISKYGDYEWFVSESEYDGCLPWSCVMNEQVEYDPYMRPCGMSESQMSHCSYCDQCYHDDNGIIRCKKGYSLSDEFPFV